MSHQATKTQTAALFLFVHMILLPNAPCICSASSGSAEKLILGFELAELSRGADISRQEKSRTSDETSVWAERAEVQRSRAGNMHHVFIFFIDILLRYRC